MAPKRKPAAGKATPKLAAHNFLPVLTKPAEVIGDYVSLQGKEWTGCPAADKEKWFRCTVRQFEGVHDFGAFKSAAFQVQEMGQSGEGSLEPGVASGGQFWIAYVNPFLKYYYAAHPDRLPDGHPDKPAQVETVAQPTQESAVTKPTPSGLPDVKQDAAVYSMFSKVTDELCGSAGANYGKRQQVWECNIKLGNGEPCCAKRTLTFIKPTHVPTNSNMISHVREAAKSCPEHAAALQQLNASSKNQVLVGGSYEAVHSFEEAFPHHVDYVWMVASGEISAVTGQKPMFRTYVRGVHAPSRLSLSLQLTLFPCRRVRAARRFSAPRDAAPHCRVRRRAAG